MDKSLFRGQTQVRKKVKNKLTVDTLDDSTVEEDMVKLFPKRQQNKAKLVIGHLNNIKLDTNNRVIYRDGTVGSTLYDLVRYFITNSGHFSAPKPIDADQFKHHFLNGVPTAAFGKNKTHEKASTGLTWITLR